jgi:hypothetical protein
MPAERVAVMAMEMEMERRHGWRGGEVVHIVRCTHARVRCMYGMELLGLGVVCAWDVCMYWVD